MLYPPRVWLKAVRPFSLLASVVPVMLGTVLAFYQTGSFRPILFLAALSSSLLLHAGTNLLNDYSDYIREKDETDGRNGQHFPLSGMMRPKHLLYGGELHYLFAVLIGIFLAMERGWPIIGLGLIGIAGGYFYSSHPFGHRYRALGEFLVFALNGPLMVLGGHYVQTGDISWIPLVISLPIGILVAAIHFANNLRDIEEDREANIHTQATILGRRRGAYLFITMIISAYLVSGLLVLVDRIPLACIFAVLLTGYYATDLILGVLKETKKEHFHFSMIDVQTAQLHLRFSVTYIAGFVIGWFLR